MAKDGQGGGGGGDGSDGVCFGLVVSPKLLGTGVCVCLAGHWQCDWVRPGSAGDAYSLSEGWIWKSLDKGNFLLCWIARRAGEVTENSAAKFP